MAAALIPFALVVTRLLTSPRKASLIAASSGSFGKGSV
jgi:hypothetical protein